MQLLSNGVYQPFALKLLDCIIWYLLVLAIRALKNHVSVVKCYFRDGPLITCGVGWNSGIFYKVFAPLSELCKYFATLSMPLEETLHSFL